MKRAIGSLLVLVAATGCSGAPAPSRPGPSGTEDLTALLRTRATTTAGADGCRPDQVAVTLEGYDAALGHRYTRITVRNVGERPCRVEGVPGIGVRGFDGSTFEPEVGRGLPMSGEPAPPDGPVELQPGTAATSDLEWTGELAAADAERAALVVVQLAVDQAPVAVPARLAGDPADADPLDIGRSTTLRLTAFTALSPEDDARPPVDRDGPVRPEK